MKTLEMEYGLKREQTFWRRQVQTETTSGQKVFDWIFGIILPVACFSLDPAVFKSSDLWGAAPYLATIKPFAYLLSFVSIMSMMAWLIWGARLKWLGGFLSGLFLVGALVSFGVALVMLPISLLGMLLAGLGVLGFIPFFTSFVYLRTAMRSFKLAQPFFRKNILVKTFLLTATF